ncbi:YMGG-like glycine zipper-containing protein [Fulvimarina endophytica]|uniref:YMGG-like glycine zipper-containing protein n=1 Tax=Fulvimarina endophytica TaxID=2293836 RepID=UPI0018F365F9|nr:YMGG-like glycine zipper-containing protein [Fulvimarina endophytica]
MTMRLACTAVLAVALATSVGCSRTQRTLAGAGIGGASGAVIGDAVGGSGGALVGAIAGGAGGAYVGRNY